MKIDRAARVAGTLLAAIAIIYLAAIIVACAGFRFAPDAAASTVRHPPILMQNNDRAYVVAAAHGLTLAPDKWTSCGLKGGLEYPCAAGQIPTFWDADMFAAWIAQGGTGTVLLDYEGHVTPAAQMADLGNVLAGSIRLAVQHGVKIIAAPVASISSGGMLAVDVAAARAGAYAVDVQCQWATRYPSVFKRIMVQYAGAIRAANPRTSVLAGIATNPQGRPVTVAQMVASYRAIRWLLHTGFWVNAANWGPPGYGYGAIGAQFLHYVLLHP